MHRNEDARVDDGIVVLRTCIVVPYESNLIATPGVPEECVQVVANQLRWHAMRT